MKKDNKLCQKSLIFGLFILIICIIVGLFMFGIIPNNNNNSDNGTNGITSNINRHNNIIE